MWFSSQYLVIVAQLTSPTDEPVCAGNRVIFTCQQSGALTRWTITLPSKMLQNSAQSLQYGSVLTFVGDPGFNFQIHIVTNTSSTITTELQVTAVRELDGITVECSGISGRFMSIIRVTSLGELANTNSVLIGMNFKFTSVNLKILQPLQVES